MRKKILVKTGLIAGALLFLLVALRLVQNNEDNITQDKNTNYYQIIDKDLDRIVEVPFTRITSYRGNRSSIYMSANHKSPSSLDNKIIQYNRKTQKYTTIFNSKFKMPSVQGIELNDNWLVWVDADEHGGQINPYSMNLKTNEIQPLAKENEEGVYNDFPILIGDYAAWIQKDDKNDEAQIMLKNLKTDITISIYNVNTYSYRNMFLSTADGKILFSDEKDNLGYLYLYDVNSKELKEFKTSYEFIGRSRLLNNHQWVYLTFGDPSKLPTGKEKMIFYDESTNRTQVVVSDILSTSGLITDFNNQVFLSYNENKYYKKFKVTNNLMVEDGWLEIPYLFRFSAKNNIYIFKQELSDDKKKINYPK